MAFNEAQAVALELERVNPMVPTLFDRDDTFYSRVEKRPAEIVSDRAMRIPLEIRPNGDSGHWDPDGGDLGRGDGPNFDKGTIQTVHLIHRLEWTTKSQWSTEDKRKAVLNTFRHNVAKSMNEFRRFCDAMSMTAGDGVLGTITSVSNAGGKDTYTCTTDGFGVKLMRFGMKINVYNSTLTVLKTPTDVKIDFYDLVNKKVRVPEVTGGGGSTGGDKIVAQGLSATPPSSIFGVAYHDNDATTGTWLGFTRSTTPEIVANSVDAVSGGLALPFARRAINKIGDRVGQDYLKKCEAWMHPCQVQAYEEIGQLSILINKGESEPGLDLYFGDNMRMAGAPVRTSYLWDKTRIDFIDLNNWGRAEYHPAGFYTSPDGKRYFEIRGASGGVAASNIFYIVASFNLFVLNPAACSYIKSLAVPTGY